MHDILTVAAHAAAPWRRPLLRVLAALFAAATALYSGIWMYGVRREPTAYLGVDEEFLATSGGLLLRSVKDGTAAQRAGLRAGDRIVAIEGHPIVSVDRFYEAILLARPGDHMRFTVERRDSPAPLALEAILGPRPRFETLLSVRIAVEVVECYPLLFLIVSAAVLLLRPEDRDAWRLALVFAALIAMAPTFEYVIPRPLRGFSLGYKFAFYGSAPALFLYFFSVFPTSSPVDRRLPWLKRAWLTAGLVVALPLAAWVLWAGTKQPIESWIRRIPFPLRPPILVYYFGGFGLGLVSLTLNALRGGSVVRRKSRVIVWGTLVGFGPALALFAAASYTRKAPYDFPFWVWTPCVMLMSLIPLSFAYAVLKHRVLEIPVLLRRSARYLLVQRGSVGLLLLTGLTAALVFSVSFGRLLGPGRETAAVALGVDFGIVLVWAGVQAQRRLSERIDRAFFRGAYDARHILQDLAEKARFATSREDLAALLEHHVKSALLPRFLAVYVELREGLLSLVRGTGAPPGVEAIPAALPALSQLALRGQPREVAERERQEIGPLGATDVDCLVPILGRGGRLTGLLVLGPRLSEEPYSGEDMRLLASVASQAGISLESLRLAEQIAEGIETERLAAHEMQLAKQVQSKLLPQATPALATLECGACCVQARAVGGDYYDFLDVGPSRLGLVLADISGKGFSAALLMANLQASLRSRSVEDMLDLPRQLRSVNQLLYRSSEPNRFATLFLGVYDDSCRRLSYANCGHNPPFLLRRDGRIERLLPTASVLGLFEEDWGCTTCEAQLDAGDLLVVFSDGITEAFSDEGEEYGEERFSELLLAHRELPVSALIDVVIRQVQEFSGSEQEDDQTLVVARVR